MMKKLKPSFDDYELEPTPQVWMKIESRLDRVPESRKGWFYFSIAAVALVAAILFLTLFYDVKIDVKPKQRETSENLKTNARQTTVEDKTGLHNESSSAVSDNPPASKDISKTVKMESPETKQAERSGVTNSHSTKRIAANTKENLLLSSKKNYKSVQPENENPDKLLSTEERTFTEKMELIDLLKSVDEQELTISTDYSNKTDQNILHPSSLSRWEISMGAAYEYNYRIINFSSGKTPITEQEKNYFKNEKGIHSLSLSALVSYSLSTHFSIVSGINYFSAGQERDQAKVTRDDSNAVAPSKNVYTVTTSSGSVVGSIDQFNGTFPTSPDTVYTHVIASPGQQASINSVVLDLKFREQFYFISLPLLIRYQMTEHRFTPYVGLGFSVGYLVAEKVLLNGEKISYHYSESHHRFLFSGEVQAGIKYKVNKHFSLSVQPSLRYGLNSINNNDRVRWIPYAWGIGGGINYRF